IAQMESMRQTLLNLINRCHGDNRPDCPILNDLAGGCQ
ncbi:MAG: Cu(I)-responsive transcriptional regulator, partial [Rhodospirillales bacterium]|nr:Cu(I)-responsive transcriptional regulator [Rhodospirillales bacterium]MCW8971130.1 Cu(I)-responsive transcriptional regulator [Rhodospirillales bacterium]MCW9001182.1 Cu(I)-responsive transcriptional regulator [Rhodospirillales bacterium]